MNTKFAALPADIVYNESIKQFVKRHIPMSVKFLKVKIKSLADESRTIRKEEKRTKDNSVREKLYLHRVKDVRQESRASHVAYGYLRGKTLLQIENKSDWSVYGWLADHYQKDHWDKVAAMVRKYGSIEHYERLADWKDGKTEEIKFTCNSPTHP